MLTGLNRYNIFGFDFKFFGDRGKLVQMMKDYHTHEPLDTNLKFIQSSLYLHWEEAKRVVTRYKVLEKAWYREKSPHKRNPDILNEVKSILENTKSWSEYTAPWGNRFPSPSHKMKLLSEIMDPVCLAMNYQYYTLPNHPEIAFHRCSRIRKEMCVMKEVSLESSAMGSQCQYRFDMTGRVPFDLFFHVKKNAKMSSFSLNAVSQKYLGANKVDLTYTDMFRCYRGGTPEGRATVARYCSMDCDLPLHLIDKMGTLVDLIEMSRVCFTPLPAIVTRGQQIKVFNQIAWWAEKWGCAMNYVKIQAPESYQGATVIAPTPGYHIEPIATLDFASLYPSIMQSHNLCYSTYVEDRYKPLVRKLETNGLVTVEKTVASGIEHWFVQRNTFHGVLPRLLHYLLSARRKVKKTMKTEKDPYKKQMMNAKQQALKISCNSVYGFTGVAEKGMLGLWPIAATCTTIGRKMIEETKEAVVTKYTTANGYNGDATVVYGDTDSVMVKFGGVTGTMEGINESFRLGIEAAAYVTNKTFRDYNEVELEMEKTSCPYWISDRKKRYIGRVWMDPDKPPKIDAKGVELVRRDNSLFLRETYGECVREMMPLEGDPLAPGEVLATLRRVISNKLKRLENNEVPLDKFIISKSLKQHYAHPESMGTVILKNKIIDRVRRGEMVRDIPRAGDRIPYVVIQGRGKLCQRMEDPEWVKKKNIKIDLEYYIMNQLRKPLTQLSCQFGPIDDLFKQSNAVIYRNRLGMKSLDAWMTAGESARSSDEDPFCVPPPPVKKKKAKKRKHVNGNIGKWMVKQVKRE